MYHRMHALHVRHNGLFHMLGVCLCVLHALQLFSDTQTTARLAARPGRREFDLPPAPLANSWVSARRSPGGGGGETVAK